MRRLYLQLYLSVAGILVAFCVLAGIAWAIHNLDNDGDVDYPGAVLLRGGAHLIAKAIPSPQATRAEKSAALARLGTWFDADVALWDNERRLVLRQGPTAPSPPSDREHSSWVYDMHSPGRAVAIRLPDGRWVTGNHGPRTGGPGRHRLGGGLIFLMGLALVIGVGAYPVVRRVTRRLERLHAQVDALAEGELSARVEVDGRDEVAKVAESFNRAAERIERLVTAQRNILASASHELRSPLARIRMASELMEGNARPELRQRIADDIQELDGLIEELLLASKLNAPNEMDNPSSIELLGLLAEEGARVGAAVDGEPASVHGDARMLRRAFRNLFDNATRHGKGTPISAELSVTATDIIIAVENGGPAVGINERDRIFAPFYRPPGSAETADGGVGLGLSLVRQIAERHGGTARWAPATRSVTRIELVLPANPA